MSDTLEGLNRAFTDVDKARKGGAGDAGIQALWGRAFLQQGEPYLARFYLEKAVAAQPDLADAHSYLALALLGTGDIAGALEHLRTAVRLAPDRPLPHYALASVYMAGKQWDQARGELSAIRQLEPDSVQLHIQLGEYYTRRGAYDNAEDEYITAMEKQRIADKVNPGGSAPGGLAAALALSRFYTDVRGSGCEKGLPAARIAQERNPRDPASLDAVGWSLVQCAKPTEALSSLENAVKSVPDSPRYHLHLGRAYALLSRTDDAREQLNRTVDLDPGGAWEEQAKAIIVGLK
jgi:tetratricopeptide (TPR) repeat protein